MADVIRLRIFRGRDYPRLFTWTRVTSRVLVSGRQEGQRQGDVTRAAGVGVMGPQAKECRQPSETGKGQETGSPLEPVEET